MIRNIILLLCLSITFSNIAQNKKWQGKFEPIDNLLPTPNGYRTASGAPGESYWQQRADYKIKAILDEENKLLKGDETITYYNNSPHDLSYLWIQLEQNVNKKSGENFDFLQGGVKDGMTTKQMQLLTRAIDFPAGYSIKYIKGSDGNPIKAMVNHTMMKVVLDKPLKSGESMIFSIGWSYPITDRSLSEMSREGYEYFPKDDNSIFLMAHWFPRMAVYSDADGWQNKQFQRLGEFALEFGNYEVEITVPADHIVPATGELLNPNDVLDKKQRKRLEKASNTFDKPIMIVSPKEAKENEKSKTTKTKTWHFKAKNVRDFSWASSRKFIWDAQAVQLETNKVMAMSFYPKEGLPQWSEESTKAVKNALEYYSEATFEYPYPVAISVNTARTGIEYPMISFNGGRPDKNGEMSQRTKEMMIGVIVHEVGHNWFPMIVSSDERQWMWMDEGLNTFMHQRAIKENYPDFNIVGGKMLQRFFSGDKNIMRPIMTTSDNELMSQFGMNFYFKASLGLEMLRHSIIGKDLFDQAFKEFANRWRYKHPNPADFFRTMEDGTAVDLDWFWRGWFYTIDNIDFELTNVEWFKVLPEPNTSKTTKTTNDNPMDFSKGPQWINMVETPDKDYYEFLSRIDQKELRKHVEGKNIYEVTIDNKGGLVMPVIIQWEFKDGTTEIDRLPVEIWRHNEYQIKKTFIKDKEVKKVTIDPKEEFPEIDTTNNSFPREKKVSEFDNFKKKQKGNH